MIQYFSNNLVSRRTIVSKHSDVRQHWMTGSYPRGGAFGACAPPPPLSLMPNEKKSTEIKWFKGTDPAKIAKIVNMNFFIKILLSLLINLG